MNKFIILALIVLSSSKFLQFAETQEEQDYDIGSIVISNENIFRFKELQTKDIFTKKIEEITKDLTKEEKEFIDAYGGVYKNITEQKTNVKSYISITNGLKPQRYVEFMERKGQTCYLHDTSLVDYKNFVTDTQKNGLELYSFRTDYEDENKNNTYRFAIVLLYQREDEKYDIVFINGSKEFTIPKEKVLKETSKNKKPEELTEDDYTYIQPTEFSEEQVKIIREWINLACKKALKSFIS